MFIRHKTALIIILFVMIFTVKLVIADVVPVVINEILASNEEQLEDPDEPGEFPDWFELYNKSSDDIDLGNMYFSDDETDLTKWQIPENTLIKANGFLLFYADDDDEQGDIHTNFKLNQATGFIALTDLDGITAIDSFSYNNQKADISYGRFPDGNPSFHYFETPSPNNQNEGGYIGEVADIVFSEERGFYNQPIQLTLTTGPEAAEIYYTIDGSEPSDNVGNGTFLFDAPISVNTTISVRAKAILTDWKPTKTITHSYLFLDDVIRQPAQPDGFPNNWGYLGAGDYEMDPDVVDDPAYSNTIKEDMKAVPTISLVMNADDWFGANGQGIYLDGELDERAVSAEWINPDGSPGFQINCGVMIVGGSSVDRWKMDKLSMRLKFQNEYGQSNLQYPLFGDEATDQFDTVVLDARMNNSWAYGGWLGISERTWLTQNDVAQFTRDQFVADLQNEMGGYAPHGRNVHLYLNGLYWGMYWVHERPDEHFTASYFGGDENDYDVIKHNAGTVVNGSNETYRQMLALARTWLSSEDSFNEMQEYLDIPNFIDYMITNFFVGNTDWASHNWYASRHKTDPAHRWRFHSWDAEHVMEGINDDVTDKDNDGGPTFLHQKLTANATYRKMFGDRLYELSTNGGVLTPARLKELYTIRLNDVDRAVVGESARWGDSHREIPFTRDVEWVAERDWMLNTYLEQRTAVILEQLRQKDLYPSITPPLFYIDKMQHTGGIVEKGDQVSMESSIGATYYTIDGSDPYIIEDSDDEDNIVLVAKNATKRVFVPKSDIGKDWRIDTDFDDSTWKLCQGDPGGIGYERATRYKDLIGLDIESDLLNRGGEPTSSCFIRIPFNLTAAELSTLKELSLKIRYDDGFVAYLNGQKIASANVPYFAKWNSSAKHNHEADAIESFEASQFLSHLKEGENLLAIHGMNVNWLSADFIILVELIARDESSGVIVSPNAIEYSKPIVIDETMTLKARSVVNNKWSVLQKADFIVTEDLSDLKITEIHYHPLAEDTMNDREFEFIELKNIGHSILNLSLCEFVNGIRYAFPSNTKLGANEYIVLASNSNFFNQRYSLDAFDSFEGNLDNAGEKLVLVDALGDTLISLRYNDKAPWPTSADGDGYSMESVNENPMGNPDDATYWKASAEVHGSPEGLIPADIEQDNILVPEQFSLLQNYPNPFNSATTIQYHLKSKGLVKLTLYDMMGREIKLLVNSQQSAGAYSVAFDASGLASGIYVYRLQISSFETCRKMLLLN